MTLANKFTQVLDKLAEQAVAEEASRQVRDAFIKVEFEKLDQKLADMIGEVTGSHPRLVVVKTAVTETIVNRNFATLNKTVTEIHSTLYGTVERLRFTPGLEFLAKDQFGVVKVTSEDLPVRLGNGEKAALFRSVLERGIVLRGREAAHLMVSRDNGFAAFNAVFLEDFLTQLFVRTEL